VTDAFLLDDETRGVPLGTPPFAVSAVASFGWRPEDGSMALPVLTLDHARFIANAEALLAYARRSGALLAPHAKTPMIPELAAAVIDRGAWGTTVASVRQAAVMARGGLKRLIIANEVGGASGSRQLARFVSLWPDVEVSCFADSPAAVAALDAAADEAQLDRPIRILAEVGAGRAGARTPEALGAVLAAIRAGEAESRLQLAGIAVYEASAAGQGIESVDAVLKLAAKAVEMARDAAGDGRRLIATGGGSFYFDRVVAILGPAVREDGASDLVLRPGSILFHDHGLYRRGLAALDGRGGFGAGESASATFQPALRVWAEVLSRPEPELVICGLGMRDISYDVEMPFPLRCFRAGSEFAAGPLRVMKLNDQHAFLTAGTDSPIAVGDVVEFGISHPCTTLHKWRTLFLLDEAGQVSGAREMLFG
jgi:D-serine dehydratase